VLTADWGPAVSKNPFLQFTLKGAKAGDKVAIDLEGQPRRHAHRRSHCQLAVSHLVS
jgi:hypothetical protein